MSPLDEHELNCPVCRARQPWQSTCRRCEADLQLYVKALRSLHTAQRQAAVAHDAGDESTSHAAERYLAWLRPRSGQ